VGPVRTLQIDNDELAVLEHDPRVALGHIALGQDDVIALHATDGDLGLVEHHAALLAALFLNMYGEHWLLRPPDRRPSRTVLSRGNHSQVGDRYVSCVPTS